MILLVSPKGKRYLRRYDPEVTLHTQEGMFEEPLKNLGCAVVPTGPGNSSTQLEIMQKLRVTGYVGTPTYLMHLAQKGEEMGLNLRKDLYLEVAFVTGEKFSEKLRSNLEKKFDIIMQQPQMWKFGFRWRGPWSLRDKGVIRMGLLMLPTAFGAAVYQLNIVIGTLLASYLPTGSISFLYYADRLVQFPLGVFGVAVGTVALPSLSKLASAGKTGEFTDTLNASLRLTLFICLPAAAGLIALADPMPANARYLDKIATSGYAFVEFRQNGEKGSRD